MPVSIFGATVSSNSVLERKVFMDTKCFVKYNAVTESINMNGNSIKNIPFPDEQSHAANRQYVDDKINTLENKLKQYIANNEVELRQYIDSVVDGKVIEKVNSMFGIPSAHL